MLVVVGVNHKAAPVAVRERVAFRADELSSALARLCEGQSEATLLSTCNRTEIYAVGEAPDTAARRQKRAVALICIFLSSGFFIWLGLDGWTVKTVPAQYVGYLIIAVGIAGLLGINIWYGGPLDPRGD